MSHRVRPHCSHLTYASDLCFSQTNAIGQFRGAIYRCDLRVRITPDLHEVYSTNQAFPSTRLAKDAVAQLALQDGVVILFKLHNSMTTKICQRLGLPIPATLEDHDTPDEENTAAILSQLVQQVTRRPDAISTSFVRGQSDTGELLIFATNKHSL